MKSLKIMIIHFRMSESFYIINIDVAALKQSRSGFDVEVAEIRRMMAVAPD